MSPIAARDGLDRRAVGDEGADLDALLDLLAAPGGCSAPRARTARTRTARTRSSSTLSALSSGARRKPSSAVAEAQRIMACRQSGARSAPVGASGGVEHDLAAIAARSCGSSLRRTSSRLCVAMRPPCPRALISRSSWKMPRVARSSRLPVGSSAIEHERIVHERARDRDALLLAARQLAREARPLRRQPDLRQQRARPCARSSPAARRSPRARRRRSPRPCGPRAAGSPGTRCRACAGAARCRARARLVELTCRSPAPRPSSAALP